MKLDKTIPCVTQTVIGDTVYIVESLASDTATETAYDKVKKLILSNVKAPNNKPEMAQKSA